MRKVISVVLSSYNGEKFITEQLESILNQTVKADEVIICDDRSTDNTQSVVRSFIENHDCKGWQFYVNEKNVGYCLNFYGAINKAKGDIIFLSDQDDIWEKEKIETMLRVMNENPDIYSLASRYSVCDENGKEIENSKITYLGDKFDDSIEYLSVNSFIGCSYVRGFSMCFRSKIKEYLKPIDLKSMLSHDWYINMLAAILSKSAVLNTKLCKYRYHHNNTSLSVLDRKTLIGNFDTRKRGLFESIEAHEYLLSLNMLSDSDIKAFKKMIALEKKRLRFLENKNIFLWMSLIGHMGSYKRYYKSLKGAIRIFIGDFLYAYKINFKVKK